jgi:hypothetical protein
VLDVGSYHARGPLRSKRQLPPALVLEDEHLLADDVRRLADAPHEELRLLEDGGPDLRVVVAAEEVAGLFLDEGPQLRPLVRLPAARVDVVGAFGPAVAAHGMTGGRYGFVFNSSMAKSMGPWPV